MTGFHLLRTDALIARGAVIALGSLGLLGACDAATETGETATWKIADGRVSPDATHLTVAVSRLGCASGKTGTVLEPQLTYEPTRIVIWTPVVPLPKNVGYNCQSNDAVRTDVTLTEPIGQRALVDGACLHDDAARTSECLDGGVRWKPQKR